MPEAEATPDDHRLAAELATEAGRLLVELRAELVASGAEATELKAEGDRRSNTFLMERLAELFPADAILSEEGGCGSWTPSTAPGSSPSRPGVTGRSTWPW
jgi:fructose-1,6-bisphosphatase/inositol monophosphatase family enzyme